MKDWTAHRGRTNNSPTFTKLVSAVDEIIRRSGHSIVNGQTESVARLIMAHLAHVHGLAPTASKETP